MLTFPSHVPSPVAVRVHQVLLSRPIQSTLHSLARELVFPRVIRIVDRQVVTIKRRCLTRVGLLLLDVSDTVAFSQGHQFHSEGVKRNLHKVLVVATAKVDSLFPTQTDPHNQSASLK